ncbi:MAG: hypothetical protein AB7G75_07985 [Candidatus Binatia bacterium]
MAKPTTLQRTVDPAKKDVDGDMLVQLDGVRSPDTMQSENVLPDQFFCSPMAARAEGPELALARAVLEDAIRCYQRQFVSSRRRTRRLAREAEEWIFSNDSSWPFSFVNICDALTINPAYIRRSLRRLLPRQRDVFLRTRKQAGMYRRTARIAA